MSIRNRLAEWLNTETDTEPSGFEQLKAALTPEPEGVELTGVFEVPTIDTQEANTAVFPVVLKDRTGDVYGFTSLEFDIPRDGDLEDTELGNFLNRHDIYSAEELDLIVGQEAEVERKDGVVVVA